MSDLAGSKDAKVLEFIEGALVYRLVWAMEAVRVRQTAIDDDFEPPNGGRAALAVETGTQDYCAALLIQSGLPSRVAATKAVADCLANFSDIRGLRYWLQSDEVTEHQVQTDWPTVETAFLWRSFVDSLKVSTTAKWSIQEHEIPVVWNGVPPIEGTNVRVLYDATSKGMEVRSIELELLGSLPHEWEIEPSGVIIARVSKTRRNLLTTYYGPKDFFE